MVMTAEKRKETMEIIKYSIVGIATTVVQYVVYAYVYYRSSDYILANLLAFLVSTFNSYYWNRRVVFGVSKETKWWKVLLKTYLVFFGTGVIATNLLSALFIECMHMSGYMAPILIVLLLYLPNYIINKRWVCKIEEETGSEEVGSDAAGDD